MFKLTPTPLDGLIVIELEMHGDERGFFIERFNSKVFEMAGLPAYFAQDNHSRSAPDVLRGLHYQHNLAQAKLVGVTRGSIWDVAVDIRPDSSSYGESFGLELSDMNGKLLWMPSGFAHGFCVTGEEIADVVYKVTTPYNPDGEKGIAWDDPDLNIEWPLASPILSKRDQTLPSFADYKNNPPQWREEA